MTRHEKYLAEVLLREIEGLQGDEAVQRLFELGLVNMRVCEQRAIREQVGRLVRQGMPCCEAMHTTAEQFCCSYEKIRGSYYNTYKS